MGYVNRLGDIVIPCQYDLAFDFSFGMAAVRRENRFGYIDVHGKTILPFIYDMASDFTKEDEAIVGQGKEQYKINKKGRIIKKMELDEDRNEKH